LVNGKVSKATIKVVCPGAANKGHPLARQSVAIRDVPVASGYTGTAATSVNAWLTWQTSKTSPAPSPAFVATFSAYRSARVPTAITVPCSGTGVMLFLPAPGSPTVHAGTVQVTFENIGA
jgi:hypothetical protein